jgi:hypothetical protein
MLLLKNASRTHTTPHPPTICTLLAPILNFPTNTNFSSISIIAEKETNLYLKHGGNPLIGSYNYLSAPEGPFDFESLPIALQHQQKRKLMKSVASRLQNIQNHNNLDESTEAFYPPKPDFFNLNGNGIGHFDSFPF